MAAETRADPRRAAQASHLVAWQDDVDRALAAFEGSPIVYFNFNNVLRDKAPAPTRARADAPAIVTPVAASTPPEPEPVPAIAIESVAIETVAVESMEIEPVEILAVEGIPFQIAPIEIAPNEIAPVELAPAVVEPVAIEAAPEPVGFQLTLAWRLSNLANPGLGLPELAPRPSVTPAPPDAAAQAPVGRPIPGFAGLGLAGLGQALPPLPAAPVVAPLPEPAPAEMSAMPPMGDMFRLVSGRQALEGRAREAMAVSRFSLGQHPGHANPPRPPAAPAAAETAPPAREPVAAEPGAPARSADLFRRL